MISEITYAYSQKENEKVITAKLVLVKNKYKAKFRLGEGTKSKPKTLLTKVKTQLKSMRDNFASFSQVIFTTII